MKSKIVITAILSGILLLPMVTVQAGNQEQAYGWQLMSEKERAEHMSTMRGLKTKEEREAYRMQHQARMQQRAMEQGVDLPMEPTGAGPAGTGTEDAPQSMDDDTDAGASESKY